METQGETVQARLRVRTHRVAKKISEETGESLLDVLDRAIELLRRKRLLQKANEAFAALRADPNAWAEEQEERSLWDNAAAPEKD